MKLIAASTLVLLTACAAGPGGSPPAQVASRPVLATPPTLNQGVSGTLLSAVDLAGEVGLAGYQLRARAITIQPGGHGAAHTHQGRPTQEYVAQGTVIEIRNGKPIQHGPGTMVQGVNGVTHWWENHGTMPVVLIPVDIVKP